jgi:hypothetical protein
MEYQSFIRGAQHTQADGYERMATMAMFNRYANNAKRASIKRMFDAKQAHRRIDRELSTWKESRTPAMNRDMYKKLKAGLNKSLSSFQEGG